MFPLWRNYNKIINEGYKNADKQPSPHLKNTMLMSLKNNERKRPFIPLCGKTIKGTSLRIPGQKKRSGRRGWVRASMTVEAAFVLPLFLLFFLNLESAVEAMRFHSHVETALWEVGREISVYGTALVGSSYLQGEELSETTEATRERDQSSVREAVGNLALSYTYIKGRVESCLGKEYLESAPIDHTAGGLQYIGSDILGEDDRVEMVVTYSISPVFRLPGFRSFLMENHYCGRLWTGYEVRDEQSVGTVFYLAENAQVFHRDRECSHLRLSVEAISRQQLPDAVNNDCSHYRACEVCTGSVMPEKLWIAKEGDCYHYRRDCPGLKRTVREVDWEEASRYRPCSRCGFTGGSL